MSQPPSLGHRTYGEQDHGARPPRPPDGDDSRRRTRSASAAPPRPAPRYPAQRRPAGAVPGRSGTVPPAQRAPRPAARPTARPRPQAAGRTDGTGGQLTSLGVVVVLAGACLVGGGMDLVLVHTAAWALTALFVGACVFTGLKVRRADWYPALVAPPLAFATGLFLIACFARHDLGQGLVGIAATMLELLALHAVAVFFGTGATASIVATRWVTRRL